jgi:putative methionine-R-sulfoxide reductase with GAF domain
MKSECSIVNADRLQLRVVSRMYSGPCPPMLKLKIWFNEKVVLAEGARQLLSEIIHVIQELFSYPHCAILLVDDKQQQLNVGASIGYREEVVQNFRVAIGAEGITGWVAEHKKPLYVPDVQKDSRYIEGIVNGRSEIAVPLLIGRRLIGVLDVESEELDAFT